jgi:tetratricopeptide (TPR) repeat protein
MEKEKSKSASISELLEKNLEADLYSKYKDKLGLNINADYLYQWALISLNEGSTEKAISFIISALDLDKRHSPTLHLLKSMVSGLSRDFYEEGGAEYKQKYDNFDELIKIIKKKAISIKKKVDKLSQEIEFMENDLNSGNFFQRFIKRFKLEDKFIAMQNQLFETKDKLERQKRELKKIKRFQKNEEYLKILTCILEICLMPKKVNVTK